MKLTARKTIAIFLIALVLRCVLFGINFSHNNFDLVATIHGDDGYYEISQGLINGHGFSGDAEPPYNPNPLRPPVWPFLIAFLAGTFGSYWAVAIFQILLGSLIPILGMRVAESLLPERLWSRYVPWVGLLMACEPYLVLLSFVLYTETCFTFLFLIFLIFLFNYVKEQTMRSAAWAGFFLGLATLVKPTVQYFPIIIPLIMLYILRKKLILHSRQLWAHLAIFLWIFCLIIAPWVYRNQQEFGVWGMSAQPAFNLYVYLVPTVLSIDNHTNFSTELNNFVLKDGFDVNKINLANSKEYTEKAIVVLKDHKIALVKSLAITGLTFFTHDGVLTVLQYSGVTVQNILSAPAFSLIAHPSELVEVLRHYIATPAVLIIIMRLAWTIATLLFIFGIIVYIRKEGLTGPVLLATVIVLYFVATTAINGLGVNARFKVPVDVFLFSFAVYGLYALRYTILSKLKKA